MDVVISLLVLSTLTQLAVPGVVPPITSIRAEVELQSGRSSIFSGESFELKCSIPDVYRSSWTYQWFRGNERLPHSGEQLIVWGAHIRDSGKYSCQGVRNTAVGDLRTHQSVPVEISVDGGWAILHVPSHPGLVGGAMEFTCRVRHEPILEEVVLYKDGNEVMRQRVPSPHIHLTNLTLKDQGMYSCRASWIVKRRTVSAISANSPVQVLELLSQPVLEIVTNKTQVPNDDMMKLICHHQYNAPHPAPPVNYYFYKDNQRLGVSKSENHDLVERIPGLYSCKVKVPELGIFKWSEAQSFKQGLVRPRAPPAVPDLDLYLPPAAKQPLTAAQTSTVPPRETTTYIERNPTTQPSDPLPPSQSPANSPPSTRRPRYQTAGPQTDDESDESSGMSGESGDKLDSI
ncbi:uncharacterized protein V6R79_019491 [Siganus canaliculatus]